MPNFTQADVDYLIAAKKYICRTIEDNSKVKPTPDELRLTLEIRRADRRTEDIGLKFRALREPGAKISKWGMALIWQGVRIRGIDYKLREDVIRGGLYAGKIRHWHEHLWTEQDHDKYVIDANGLVKKEDKTSLIETCMDRWNIEGFFHQYRLEGQ